MAKKSIPVEVTLPPISQPLFDKTSGLVTEPWYRYFEATRNRTGGDVDLVDDTKVAASVADDNAGIADQKAVNADQKAGIADGKAVEAQEGVDSLNLALATTDAEQYEQGLVIAEHEGRLDGHDTELADHEARIAALEAAVFP